MKKEDVKAVYCRFFCTFAENNTITHSLIKIMKKVMMMLACAAGLFTACSEQQAAAPVETVAEGKAALHAAIEALRADTTMTEEAFEAAYNQLLEETYQKHVNDSLGLQLFTELGVETWDAKTIKANFEAADTLIQNNERCQRYVMLAENREKTAVGTAYVNIEGQNIRNLDEKMSIENVLAEGKPVLVDFFASWCPPCRKAIKTELPDLVKKYEGKMNLLGIDVWENKLEDIQKAMEELPISWRVIYTGGRENSPAYGYGVSSIPTMVLLGADGTILARGHELADILPALEKVTAE